MTREEALAQNANAIALFNALTSGNDDTEALVDEAYANLLGLEGDFSNAAERKAFWINQFESGDVTEENFAEEFLFLAQNEPGDLTEEEQAFNTGAVPTVAEASNGVAAQLEAEGRNIQDLTGEEVAEFAQSIRESASAAGQAAAEAARQEQEEQEGEGDDAGQEEDGQEESGQDGSQESEGADLPSYSLEEAMVLFGQNDLPNEFNVNSAIFENSFTSLSGAADKANDAYSVLDKASNRPNDDDADDGAALIDTFLRLFPYTVEEGKASYGVEGDTITVNEGLAAYYAQNKNDIFTYFENQNSPVTLEDSAGEIFENTDAPATIETDTQAVIEAVSTVKVQNALTVAQAVALNDAASDTAMLTYDINDDLSKIVEADYAGALENATNVTARDVGESTGTKLVLTANAIDFGGSANLTLEQFNAVTASGFATVDTDAITVTGTGDPDEINLLNHGDASIIVNAGKGEDTIIAGAGSNRIVGSDGADTFKIVTDANDSTSRPVIDDYTFADGDVIDISDVNYNVDVIEGGLLQNFEFRTGALEDVPGSASDFVIELLGDQDTNGSTASSVVVLEGKADSNVRIDLGGLLSNTPEWMPNEIKEAIISRAGGATIQGDSAAGQLLLGGDGAQTLIGGDGNDIIAGAGGTNTYHSSLGADTYIGTDGEVADFTYTSASHSSVGSPDTFDFLTDSVPSSQKAVINFAGADFSDVVANRGGETPDILAGGLVVESSSFTESTELADADNGFFVAGDKQLKTDTTQATLDEQYSFVYVNNGDNTYELYVDANGDGQLDANDMHIKLLGTITVDTQFDGAM